MKSTLTAFFTFILISLSFLTGANQAYADTSTTDVKIATESGATYLTTTTISTSSTTVVPAASPISTRLGPIFLPPGFFPSASSLTNQIFKVIMVISVILVFAYLVLGGIQYITSGGEKAKTEAARNKIISAIVGLIIVASSYAILTLALNFIGYKDFNGFIDVGTPGPVVIGSPTPFITPMPTPSPTPTPTSALQKLLQ